MRSFCRFFKKSKQVVMQVGCRCRPAGSFPEGRPRSKHPGKQQLDYREWVVCDSCPLPWLSPQSYLDITSCRCEGDPKSQAVCHLGFASLIMLFIGIFEPRIEVNK